MRITVCHRVNLISGERIEAEFQFKQHTRAPQKNGSSGGGSIYIAVHHRKNERAAKQRCRKTQARDGIRREEHCEYDGQHELHCIQRLDLYEDSHSYLIKIKKCIT
jgi:hypothetical protein